MSTRTLPILLVSLAVAHALAGAAGGSGPGAAPPQDPWTGQPREAIEGILGEPDSIKKADGGGAQLVYKLRRLAPGEAVGDGIVVLQLPDGGLAGRVLHGRVASEKLAMEPSGLDEHGRPVAGGFTRTESRSASVEVGHGKEHKVKTDPPDETGPPVQGRVKIVFHVGADGRVTRWETAGRK